MEHSEHNLVTYEDVVAEIERVVDSRTDDPVGAATMANASDLLVACRGRVRTPDEVGTGYLATIWLEWDGLQVEVFDDHYEIYRLKEGETNIRHESHNPGTAVSSRLIDELAAVP
jgi:hypothetical protein